MLLLCYNSDVIILVDIDSADARCNRNALYVATSRAKHRLFVFGKNADVLK